MRAGGNVIKGHEILFLHPDLEGLKSWAKSTFTKEKMAEVGVLAATPVLFGVLGAALYQGLQNYTIAGVSPFLASANWQLSIPGY